MRILKYSVPAVLIAGFVFIAFLFFSGNKAEGYYNFLCRFDEAEKTGFSGGEDLDDLLPQRPLSFEQDFLMKELIALFSDRVEILSKNGVIFNLPDKPVRDAGFRFIYKSSKAVPNFYSFYFKVKDKKNYWKAEVVSSKTEGIVRIFKSKDGKEILQDNFTYNLNITGNNILQIVFFGDFLLVLDEDTLLYQQKEKDLDAPGAISVSTQGWTGNADYTIKFAEMNIALSNKLVKWHKSNFPDCREHKFNFKESAWSKLQLKSLLPIDGKTNEYIRRVKLGNETRPAVFFKMNSRLTYTVKFPKNAVLEFFLSVVPVYIVKTERLRFVVEIAESGGKAKIINLNLGKFKNVRSSFCPVKAILYDFSGKKCRITFKLCTADGKLISDESRIIAALAAPAIYQKRKPDELNVVLISLDTLRASNLGCYGYRRDTSLKIDKFAKNGTIFLNATSCSNWTLPSHMSILTSLFPYECGFEREKKDFSRTYIADGVYTLAEYLRDAGYKTAAFHGGGYVSDFYHFDKGFDLYFKTVKDSNRAIDQTLSWLERNKNQRFFLFFHTFEIHEPYKHSYFLSQLAPDKKSERDIVEAKYDSGIRYADGSIGRMLDWFKTNGLFEKTIIIITSDHGENFDFIRRPQYAGTHGITMYEAETQVPLIFGGATKISTGSKIEEQVSSVDIMPTVLSLLDIPLKKEVRGVDLMPIIAGEKKGSRMAYAEASFTVNEKKAVRSNDFKLIADFPVGRRRGVIPVRYELYYLKGSKIEEENLFYIRTDVAGDYKGHLMNIVASIEKNKNRLQKRRQAAPAKDKELLNDLKALGYVGN